jgi:hypothetical protein
MECVKLGIVGIGTMGSVPPVLNDARYTGPVAR